MEWTDDGIIIYSQKQGDSSLILRCFTRHHGRHSGLVKGGNSKRFRGITQVGNEVQVIWKGRVSTQLGHFAVETRKSRLATIMEQSLTLSAMSSALALLEISLPEREPHEALYDATLVLMDSLELATEENWLPIYVKWETGLLTELGYGLDFSQCAATGSRENLIYVSPKSGRAVSAEAGAPYHDKLLPLPAFLKSSGGKLSSFPSQKDIEDGVKLTGYFLDKYLRRSVHKTICPARQRFLSRLNKIKVKRDEKHMI
jgi:DNA repair protein RecO (recombination protein O)